MDPLSQSRRNIDKEYGTINRILNQRAGIRRMIERTEKVLEAEGEQYRAYADYVKKVRTEVVDNLAEVVEEAVKNFAAKGFTVHGPADSDEACAIVDEVMAGERFAVKGKSKVTKEIGLTRYLEGKGATVIETDVGDRALQLFAKYHQQMGLAPEKPRHASGPGIGLNRHDFAKVVEKAYDTSFEGLSDDEVVEKEVRLIKEEVINAYENANVGIVGANALSAEGYAVLMHNEGNIGRAALVAKRTGEPSKLIIVTSVEKILPTIEDCITKTRVEAIYATGATPSFIDIVGGPSKTADIERILFKGVSGPSQVHLVLVDNGRLKVSKSRYRQVLTCVSCGRCIFHCPSYDKVGPALGYKGYPGGIGSLYCGLYNSPDEAAENGLFLCTTCGRCEVDCPMSIPTNELIVTMRSEVGFLDDVEFLSGIKASLGQFGNVYSRENSFVKELAADPRVNPKSQRLLYVGCSIAFKYGRTAKAALNLLDKIGLDVQVTADEACCGEPARTHL